MEKGLAFLPPGMVGRVDGLDLIHVDGFRVSAWWPLRLSSGPDFQYQTAVFETAWTSKTVLFHRNGPVHML